MIKLVALDWNGTLLADTRACLDADNAMLKALGKKPVSLKRYRETMTIPAIEFYVKNGCSRKEILRHSKKLSALFHKTYERETSKIRTRSGTKKLLRWLKKRSINTIILSNHTTYDIERQLKRLKIKDYVSTVLANPADGTALRRRNKLEKLRDYMKTNGYGKKSAVIIGDSPEEAEIGKHLEITSIAVKDGYYSDSRLKASKPDYFVSELSGIIKLLNRQKNWFVKNRHV